jgi:hypothetical protein
MKTALVEPGRLVDVRIAGRARVLTVAGVGVILVAFLAAVPNRSDDRSTAPLADRVRQFAKTLREDDPYQPPDERERRRFAAAMMRLGDRSPDASPEELRSLGMVVEEGTDEQTGRPYALVAEAPGAERGWGLYVVDLSRPAGIAVQVPHPANDLHTDEIGVELFRRVPGAVLAVAGTHRRAANGAGDMAHRTDSMFHALAEEQARRRLPQVQLHGFDDDSLPTADVVLSPGPGDAGDSIQRVAEDLPGGLRVCRTWRSACGELEGTRNAQGGTAAKHATVFFHVEINRAVRNAPAKWTGLVDAIAKTMH